MIFLRNTSSGKNRALAQIIEAAANDLESQLLKLDYRALPISSYGKNYYAYDLRKLRYMLQAYSVMLFESVIYTGKSIEKITLLDHGAGVGIFSLLAKLSGAGTVIHQDINPEVSKDASVIAQALNIPIDRFIWGDTDDFVNDLISTNTRIDVVGSRNVIEHVYSIDAFFKSVSRLPSDKLILYISTTANMKNPLVNRYTRKIHRDYEYNGKPVQWGGKERDASTSCMAVRKKIIREKFPSLNTGELDELAMRTRGLILHDIYQRVQSYIDTNKMPDPISDPTNTCDPFTGNWAEHLVPLTEYQKIAEQNGFHFNYRPGFYNTNYPQKILNLFTPVLNFSIRVLGKGSLFLAPFVSLVLVKKSKS